MLSNVTVSPLLKMVSTWLVCQLELPLASQMFAAPSPLQMSARGAMTMFAFGVALASGEFGLKPVLLAEATT